ncbi:hypothetical protein BD408DRAFT_160256 [Parasitella parasitica]|nr:hypothetical protein BD408DRAFT_160256 [Parasitella parasitica]
MTRHYRIHTNDRPYQCPLSFCGKRFIQRSALTVHQRTHSGEKPHICQFPSCNKSFGDSSSLARHRRIHTQTRSYVCTEMYCTKSYTKKSHLTRHTRRSHIKDENSESMFASKMKKTINPVPTAATTDDDDDEEEEEVDYDPALVKQEILTNRISPAMVCPSNAVNQQPNYWAMNPPCYIPTVYQSAGDGYFYHGQQNYYSF